MANQLPHCAYVQGFNCDTCEFIGCQHHPVNQSDYPEINLEAQLAMQAQQIEELYEPYV